MKNILIFSLLLFVVVATGCNDIQSKPTKLTLYSIDGMVDVRGDVVDVTDSEFYGYPIVGRISFDDPATCIEILDKLSKARRDSDGSANKCFWPRHGIQVEYDNGHKADYVICFSCKQLEVYEDGSKTRDTTTNKPMEYFNKKLSDANIPVVDIFPRK